MIVEFSVVPLGSGASLSGDLAPILDIIDKSGLQYKFGPMSTSVEGDWDAVMDLMKKCRDAALEKADRVLLRIVVDDKKGATGRLTGKQASVEAKLGRELKK
ncbi:MAG: MTH1187 family thiamine-binding protein [Deltaproteobacteria bacterium]|nr:MTH1187 family thiamine-binding protein [Deltaproteobacteria bacterium]